MKKISLISLSFFFAFLTCSLQAQFEWVRVSLECPCEIESTDGKTALVNIALENFEPIATDNLYITVAATGTFEGEEFTNKKRLFLGTNSLETILDGEQSKEQALYEVELGKMPIGQVNLEVILHEGPRITPDSILDFVWFEGEVELPFTTLKLQNVDYLVDSDGDGTDDVNERFMNTDPDDPNSTPPSPVIDVVVVYESTISSAFLGGDAELGIQHIFNVSTDLYQESGVDLQFRLVGMHNESDYPQVFNGPFLPDSIRNNLQEQYGADLIVVFHLGRSGFCGIAEDIGGWRGEGFIHEFDRAILTHVLLNPAICPINVTAHEIGHLVGLGHSFVQGAIGTYYWSRGHGEHNKFGTIMSYAMTDYNGINVNKFSDPDALCNGDPCGISHNHSNLEMGADSVTSTNITKYQVASTGTPPTDLDFDGDGFMAHEDAFPVDPTEWLDSDGDGFGDNRDEFPNDPMEWADFDGDGIGDNRDPDIDNDGIANIHDHDAFDPMVTTVKIIDIVSEQANANFGWEVAKVNDLDNDGVRDFVFAAPGMDYGSNTNVGALYLLPHVELQKFSTVGNQPRTTRSLDGILDKESSWIIHGDNARDLLGLHMAYLEGDPAHLVASAGNSAYLIELSDTSLSAFDSLDGSADRELSLAHCESAEGCWFLGNNPDFVLGGVIEIADRDFDGLFDFALAGSRYSADDLSIYIFTTDEIRSRLSGTSTQDNAIDRIVEDSSKCFRVNVSTFRNQIVFANLGNVTGDIYPAIGIGFAGQGWLAPGSFYVLNTDLLALWDLLDDAPDGQVNVEDLFGMDYGSYMLSGGLQDLARAVNVIHDMDGDGRDEIFLWGGLGVHSLISTTGLNSLDQTDGMIDGIGNVDPGAPVPDGVWFVYGFAGGGISRNQSILTSADPTAGFVYVEGTGNFSIRVSITDLATFDEADSGGSDRRIDLSGQIGNLGSNVFTNTVGLRGGGLMTGISALGDLDGDNQLDFMYTDHIRDEDNTIVSSTNVIFSGSVRALDRGDGSNDGVVSMHNNLDDTDHDGTINLLDEDDDNDGALDTFDRYPLEASAKYDADGDGIANVLDLFPADPSAHSDLDGDGIADSRDDDRDGDGLVNFLDNHPDDTDNDGIDNHEDLDDDNDGVHDDEDAFPLDPAEQKDSDGDGYGDNVDAFVNDSSEWIDSDKDGIGDNSDPDDDNDGYADTIDLYPLNKDEWVDSDGDGLGDNADAFPMNRFEWLDEDGDGFGDNFGDTTIESVRLKSDWATGPLGLRQTLDVFYIGTTSPETGAQLFIETSDITNPRFPNHLLSQSDINKLDQSDGMANRTIDIDHISDGSNSWEIRGQYATLQPLLINSGLVTDVDTDSIPDLVLNAPIDNDFFGSLYIVRGGSMAAADVFDGRSDQKINYVQCPGNEDCIVVQNDFRNSSFAYAATELNGLFGEGQSTLVATNYEASPWTPDAGGVPLLTLLPNRVIMEAVTEMKTGELTLSELLMNEATMTVYSELSGGSSTASFASLVHQLLDFDGDDADDLLVTLPASGRSYILGSKDIRRVHQDNLMMQAKLSIADILENSNSYSLSNIVISPTASRSVAYGMKDLDSRLQIFSIRSEPQSVYLVDLNELSAHDAEDGNQDGVISTFDITDSSTWKINGLTAGKLCTSGGENGFDYVLGEFSTWSGSEHKFFSLDTARTLLNSDSDEGNVIDVSSAANTQTSDLWTINFSLPADVAIAYTSIQCAGDWNDDGQPDIVVGSLYRNRNFEDFRTEIILLMSSDLPALDARDGTKDYRVNVGLLFQTATDE